MTTLSNRSHAARRVAQYRPYARLYRAVILRAVHDLSQQEHGDDAREWLLSPESDYAFCTAGMSSNNIRQQML
jgi:hypothetical protein